MKDRKRYEKALVGPIERFDQMNEMFKRARYDPEWIERSKAFYTADRARDKYGFTHEYHALGNASWYLEDCFAKGCGGSNLHGLYSWESLIPDMEEAGLAKRVGVGHSTVHRIWQIYGLKPHCIETFKFSRDP